MVRRASRLTDVSRSRPPGPARPEQVRPPGALYGAGLRAAGRGQGDGWRLRYADGSTQPLPLGDWAGELRPGDQRLVDRCHGSTLDVGCGPGRLTAALARCGLPALGVDICADAVALSRRRGGTALQRDVFGPLPGEGRWRTILLVDGNIGIGGGPVALLARCASLLHPEGTVLCETGPPGGGVRRVRVRLEAPEGCRSSWFRWAHVGFDAIAATARTAGVEPADTWTDAGRWFVALRRR